MKQSRQERINNILDLYFSRISDRNISAELETSIRNWFKESVNVSEKYTALELAFEKWLLYNDEPSGRAIVSWIDTMRALDLPVSGEILRRSAKKRIPLRRIAMRVAAVALPLLAIAGVYLWQSSDRIVETVPSGMAMRSLQLPDGTDVWMRSGSRMEYPAKFAGGRRVDVLGEVFFNVAKKEGRDFMVNTGDVKIRVTGTKFNCAAHAGKNTTVTLHEGSVKVKADKGWIGMQQGEQFNYDATTGKGTTEKVDLTDLDWRHRVMDFVNLTLSEIFEHLSEAYSIAFEYNTHFSHSRYLASFYPDEELSVVLSVLQSITHEFSFEIMPEKVIINNPTK